MDYSIVPTISMNHIIITSILAYGAYRIYKNNKN